MKTDVNSVIATSVLQACCRGGTKGDLDGNSAFASFTVLDIFSEAKVGKRAWF